MFSTLIERLRAVGPGALIAASFVGPGTVTTVSATGAEFGYALTWTIVFSIFATIVLQEMSARLGIVSRNGLGEALRTQLDNAGVRYTLTSLAIGALVIGTSSYAVGDLTGGAVGFAEFTNTGTQIWPPIIAGVIAALLWTGNYKLIERVFVGLLMVLLVSFVVTALLVGPDFSALVTGLVPTVPDGSQYLIAGLLGTTIVGYNFFLHASSVQDRWSGPDELPESRLDTILTITIGGIVTLSIMITAAAAFSLGTEINDLARISEQLRPAAGGHASTIFSIGLIAASFTSASTGPLATAYAVAGMLGWERDLSSTKFRAVWVPILLFGTIGASLGINPVEIILTAQVLNLLLLPTVLLILIYFVNDSDLVGEFTNNLRQNIVGAAVTLVIIGISLQSLVSVLTDLL